MEVDHHTCVQRSKKFSNISNLRKHVIKFHPDNGEYLASLQLRKRKVYSFACKQCHKRFSHAKNLRYHVKTHGTSEDSPDQRRNAPSNSTSSTITKSANVNQCAMYTSFSADKNTVIEHYKQFHSISIDQKKMSFQSEEEFVRWKLRFENDTNCKYVIHSRKKCKSHISTDFICHRSGRYVPEGKQIRHLKILGSKKINALCLAGIKLKKHNNGTCEVAIIDKHVGHTNDIGHLTLSKTERENLAVKIASKVLFDDILDEIRESITDSELKRLHLLTKKDLYNIETSFNLSSSSVRHKNDVISVESWINEMRSNGDAILFYKPQGCVSEEWPALKTEDFVLIIMTAAQREMLKKYGNDCICIDGTHGMNNYDFELITLLIIDDIQQGFPCSFLVSNRSDKELLKIFFHFVKIQLDTELSPNVFMSDMADSFFNAWIEIMSPPKLRLYCTWHVDQAWRKNLSKINTKEKQALIYKNLRTVLEERDVTTSNILISKLYAMLLEDPDTLEFANYFNKYYLSCIERWAYCHRLVAGLNTYMHLERMHKTLKYTYLKGKKVKRLDKAINAIMRFVRDKCMDRLIVINKGKLSSKLQLIRSRHKNSLSLKKDLVVECENGWNIASETTAELYLVQKNQEHCKCTLLCDECKTCIHQFCCSCLDSSVKYNMCKHIHLLCRCITENETVTLQSQESAGPYESNLTIVEEEPHALEEEAHLKELSSNSKLKSASFASKKQRAASILEDLQRIVASSTSDAELDVIIKAVVPIKHTLTPLKETKCIQIKPSTPEPHNKNIHKQRFWSTRKKPKYKNKKPKLETASNETALQLLSL